MSRLVDFWIHPDPVGPGGTHPKLLLWSHGVITGQGGAASPKKSPDDHSNFTDWNQGRYNALLTPSVGGQLGSWNGEIAQAIVVTDYSDLSDIHGHTLMGWGTLTPFGSTQTDITTTDGGNHYEGPSLLSPGGVGWNIFRDVALNPLTGYQNGYILDGQAGMHSCGVPGIAAEILPGTGRHGMSVPPNPFFAGLDAARRCRVDWSSGTARGVIMTGKGDVWTCSQNPADAWMASTYGGGYWPNNFVFWGMDWDYASTIGMALRGDGHPLEFSKDPAYGPPNQPGHDIGGAPHWEGDFYHAIQFRWPDKTKRFFAVGTYLGDVIEFDGFVVPNIQITSPVASQSSTDIPEIALIYGAGQAANPPAPLGQARVYVYDLAGGAVTHPESGVNDAGQPALFAYFDPGVTGVAQGQTFTTGPMAVHLQDLHTFRLYIKVTSTEGASFEVVTSFGTALVRPTPVPVLSVTDAADGAGVVRNVVAITNGAAGAGHVFRYQYSDDLSHWYDLPGASATTATSVNDYWAAQLLVRYYRAFKVKVNPELQSNPSAVVSHTLPLAATSSRWSVRTLSSPPTIVFIKAFEYDEALVQLLSIKAPTSRRFRTGQSGGTKGHEGTVRLRTMNAANHKALMDLLGDPQVLMLGTNVGIQRFFWPGERIDKGLVRAGKIAADPFPIRQLFEVEMPWIEVDHPIVT